MRILSMTLVVALVGSLSLLSAGCSTTREQERVISCEGGDSPGGVCKKKKKHADQSRPYVAPGSGARL